MENVYVEKKKATKRTNNQRNSVRKTAEHKKKLCQALNVTKLYKIL